MLIRTSVPGFRNRIYATAGALFVPLFDAMVPRHRNVLAIVSGPAGKLLVPASNIITNAGDVYYAQRGAAASPTNAFGIHEMCSAGTPDKTADRSDFTPIASTGKAHASTYPKANDDDGDNTGAGADIVTYKAIYAKGDFNHAAITHGIITNTSPGGSEPILTGYAFASSIEKTADDTLTVYVNHEMTGV